MAKRIYLLTVVGLIMLATPTPANRVSADTNEGPSIAAQGHITAGQYHTCARTNSGTVKCWGTGDQGALGNNSQITSDIPVNVHSSSSVSTPLSGILSVTSGHSHSCALTTLGTVKCWGYGSQGQLGNGSTLSSSTPVDVHTSSLDSTPLSGIVSISAGASFTCALTSGGTVKCWGFNLFRTLGNGTSADSSTPTDVHTSSLDSTPLSGIISISSGYRHVCAVTATQNVKCWGSNASGQLGDGSYSTRSTPVDVRSSVADSTPLSGIVAVTGGGYHSCALTSSGAVKCWGTNSSGELGHGLSVAESTSPVNVRTSSSDSSPLTGITAVAAGGNFNCVLTLTSTLKCWGQGADGQLGNGYNTDRTSPDDVLTISGAIAITAGMSHACAINDVGTVLCWGDNSLGQLGDGSASYLSSSTPGSVAGVTTSIPDTVAPTATIGRSGTGTLSTTDTITFELSESSTDFDQGDVTVSSGALSAFAGSGTSYTATLTPPTNSSGTIAIDIDAAVFTDAANNDNVAATRLNIAFDTRVATTTTQATTSTTAPGSTTTTSIGSSTSQPGSSSTSIGEEVLPPTGADSRRSTIPALLLIFGGIFALMWCIKFGNAEQRRHFTETS